MLPFVSLGSVVITLGLAAIPNAPNPNALRLPAKAPPTHGVARVEGEIAILTVPTIRYETRNKLDVNTGITKQYTSPVMVFEVRRTAVKDVKFFDTTGKRIASAAAAERLKKDTSVLISFHGVVDPFYLSIIRPDTLVLVMPPMMVAPPVPAPNLNGNP